MPKKVLTFNKKENKSKNVCFGLVVNRKWSTLSINRPLAVIKKQNWRMKLFNFLKNKIELKKVGLTFELDINDSVFIDYKKIKKINIGEINSKYGYDILKDDRNTKNENIVKEIISSESDIIIGYGFYELMDLVDINNKLKNTKFRLNQIFIPSEERRNRELKEGQKLYQEHNRWIDFYPGQVEDVHKSKEKKYYEIKKYFSNSNIEIVEI